ncbi:hypothetical protein [Myxococcus sp. Y35]|uniref:hypothetical protein n=1 Tax=Pseudomyxococcus flavus TaxID=3115648 RepID=UPI003CEFF4D2
MKILKWALMGLMVVNSGCVTSVRASSREHLSAKNSEVVLQGTTDDAARRLTELFSKRGIQVTDRQVRRDGSTLYTFKGTRSTLTTVGPGPFGTTGTTNTVGSAFYALLIQQGETTKVALMGNPTVDNRNVCSDDAPAWVPSCSEDVYANPNWDGLDQITGKEEAETIRGLLVELDLTRGSGPGLMAARSESEANQPFEAPKPACIASELPEWKEASSVEKKQLLEKCRGPAADAP